MFLELDKELINLDTVSKIKMMKVTPKDWRIVFSNSDKEVKNISFATELLMIAAYTKLKNFLVTGDAIKRLGELS